MTPRTLIMIPKTMKELTPEIQAIVKRMQEMRFGTIRDLPVIRGQPQLHMAHIIKRRRLSKPKPLSEYSVDFKLREEHLELIATLNEIRDGMIVCLEVQHGLPFHIDIAE